MRPLGRLVLVLGTVCLGACGASPAAPSPASTTTTVTAITVLSASSVLAAGTHEAFTATATKSDGSTGTVTSGQWSSDASAVATVDGAGSVTAVSPGDATISVDLSGVRGSKRISVRANYQGRWSGNYVVNSCTDTQGFASAGACSHLFPPNSGIQYTLEFVLAQSGDRVTGQALFGTLPSPLAPASVAANGSLQTTSTTTATTTATTSHTWNLGITRPGQMDGTMVLVGTDSKVSGSVTVNTTLVNVVLVGTAASTRAFSRR